MSVRTATHLQCFPCRANILAATAAGMSICLDTAASGAVRHDGADRYPQPGTDMAQAGDRPFGIDPSQLCGAAITATERMTGIPDAFLSAIGRVESGREGGGTRHPWPWTVNAAGEGHFYPTKQAAIDAVRQFLAAGVKSLDLGCLQVNIMFHPDAFPTLDQAFDPAANAAYAGQLLMDLFRSTGSWPRAAAAYHSMTPALGAAYLQRVLEEWALPDHSPQAGREGGAAPARARRDDPASVPPMVTPRDIGEAAPPPAFGFSRRFMLAQGPAPSGLTTGRTLAAYRAVPIRVVLRRIQPAH